MSYFLVSPCLETDFLRHITREKVRRRITSFTHKVKRRSYKMAAAFRTERSCVLLFYAVIRNLHFNQLTMPAPSTNQTSRFYTIIDKLPTQKLVNDISHHLSVWPLNHGLRIDSTA